MRRLFSALSFFSSRLAASAFLRRFAQPGRRRLDSVDEEILARARRSRLAVGDETIEVYEWGPSGAASAPSVLIVHGWGSHAPRFSAFVEAILAKGWCALAFDAPGHGRSTGERSSLMQFRAAIDAVSDRHGPVEGFIAHSLGALALTLRLGDPGVAPVAKAAVLISMPRDARYLMNLYLDALGAKPQVRARVEQGFTKRYGLRIEALDGAAVAAQIPCPVLIVHDHDDESVPVEQAHALQAGIGGARLHLTRGLGHNRLLRDEAVVGASIEFLEASLPAAT